jgi:hypothetical protein
MGRLRNKGILNSETLLGRIALLDETLLDPVGRMLRKLVEASRGTDGTWNNENSQTVLQHVGRLLDRLPEEQGTRFVFDAMMIKSIASAWNTGGTQLSGAIVPAYGNDWRLERHVLYPGPQLDQVHLLELLVFQGENCVEDVDLTEYGWIVHELAHSLLHKNSKAAIAAMTRRLEIPLRDIQAGAIVDRSHAKSIRQPITDQIVAFWRPTANQQNWSHELVTDIVSVVTAGSAYGRIFLEDTASDAVRPFDLTRSHPPLAVRCAALGWAADQLGLAELASMLAARSRRWSDGEFGRPTNLYRAAAAEEIIASGIDAAFDIVRELHLPKCTPDMQIAVATRVDTGSVPMPGIDMLLAAWHANDTMDSATMSKWTAKAIKDIAE